MKHTVGPLPAGWHLNGPYAPGFLTREDGAESYIYDSNGRIDRNTVATILENYGYYEYAKRWSMDSVHAAAPDLLAALRVDLKRVEDLGSSIPQQAGMWDQWAQDIRAAIAKATPQP